MRPLTAEHVTAAFDDLENFGKVQFPRSPTSLEDVAQAHEHGAFEALNESVGLTDEAAREFAARLDAWAPLSLIPRDPELCWQLGWNTAFLIGLRAGLEREGHGAEAAEDD